MRQSAVRAGLEVPVKSKKMITIEELYKLFLKCPAVTTDSRNVPAGAMFFALKGENFDGNDFAVGALKAGARFAVVDRIALEGVHVGPGGWRRCILVENVLQTLQALARYHRRQFNVPVIGITGTNGKTTTKELVSAVLSRKYDTVYTTGNLNNHIGVPLTLLRMNRRTRMAVIEMGASSPGEIAVLADIAEPTHGIVTNVGRAHLEGFGSFEKIKKTKGELYDFLRQSGGAVFCNADNPVIGEMVASRPGLRIIRYGQSVSGSKVLPVTSEHPFLRLQVGEKGPVISTHLVGSYNADNVLAALAVASCFEVPEADAITALEEYVPSNDRSQMVATGHNTLIVDAYNANPTSMNTALDNLAASEFPGKTVMIGDMLELGEVSCSEHEAVISKALGITDSVFLVGGEFAAAATKAGCADKVKCFPDVAALRAYLADNPLSGRTILIKGSHGMHLERLRDSL